MFLGATFHQKTFLFHKFFWCLSKSLRKWPLFVEKSQNYYLYMIFLTPKSGKISKNVTPKNTSPFHGQNLKTWQKHNFLGHPVVTCLKIDNSSFKFYWLTRPGIVGPGPYLHNNNMNIPSHVLAFDGLEMMFRNMSWNRGAMSSVSWCAGEAVEK